MLKIESLHDSGDDLRAPGMLESSEESECGCLDAGFSAGGFTGSLPKHGRRNNDGVKNRITKLTSGVRDPNRVNVFIDEKFAFSLDISQVVDLGVKVGKILSEEELQNLQAASAFGKLYQRTLEWILSRPHSAQEVRTYLKTRQAKRVQNNRQRVRQELKPLPEIQDETIVLVLERLNEHGHIDDRRFAEYYVENRFNKKGISRKRLQMELRKKGISEGIVAEVLDNSLRNDHEEIAKIIARKASRYDHDKLIAYLCRQGFSYQNVLEAVEEFEEGVGEA